MFHDLARQCKMRRISSHLGIADIFLVPVVITVNCVQNMPVSIAKVAFLDYSGKIVFRFDKKEFSTPATWTQAVWV